jgi:hypothetical protein
MLGGRRQLKAVEAHSIKMLSDGQSGSQYGRALQSCQGFHRDFDVWATGQGTTKITQDPVAVVNQRQYSFFFGMCRGYHMRQRPGNGSHQARSVRAGRCRILDNRIPHADIDMTAASTKCCLLFLYARLPSINYVTQRLETGSRSARPTDQWINPDDSESGRSRTDNLQEKFDAFESAKPGITGNRSLVVDVA